MTDVRAADARLTRTASQRTAHIAALILAALLPFVAALLYFVLLSEHPIAKVIYSGTKVFTLLWPVLAYKLIFRQPLPPFPLRPNAGRSLYWGALSGLAIGLILFLLLGTSLGKVVLDASPAIRAKAASLGILGYYVPFALFLSLVHSLIEEYYWRWYVFGEFRSLLHSEVQAHLLAGLAFALHHIVVTTQFFPFAYGVVFGLFVGIGGVTWSVLFAKQHSLLGSWISHMIVDLAILGAGFRLLGLG